MSVWERLRNTLRNERLQNEIDEEFKSHLDEALAHGRDPEEARRAFGSPTIRLPTCQRILPHIRTSVDGFVALLYQFQPRRKCRSMSFHFRTKPLGRFMPP